MSRQGKLDGPGLCIMFGGVVSGDDDVIGESDGETGGDGGVGCVAQVICIYPYVPLVYKHNDLVPKGVNDCRGNNVEEFWGC